MSSNTSSDVPADPDEAAGGERRTSDDPPLPTWTVLHERIEQLVRGRVWKLVREGSVRGAPMDTHDICQTVARRVFDCKGDEILAWDEARQNAYLRECIENRMREEVRSAAGRMKPQRLDAAGDRSPRPVADAASGPDARAADRERREKIAQRLQFLLDQIDRDSQEIFVMHRQRGMSHKAIADKLGVSHDAVRQRYSRALGQMRSMAAELGWAEVV